MSNFKIGDRVELINNMMIPMGSKGTVVEIRQTSDFIGVEFDENMWELCKNGHSCDGNAKQGHGYYLQSFNFKLIQDEKDAPKQKIRWYSKGRFTKWENK